MLVWSKRVAILVCSALAFWCALDATAAKAKKYLKEDLINIFLGPEYSQWLVGPIARIASGSEIERFLELAEDQAAKEFIEEFWRLREQGTEWPNPTPRIIFEQRARQADVVFSESAILGRRSDRGMILVLYGSPAQSGFEISPRRGESPIEVWVYPKGAPKGLNGQVPERYYRFQKRVDLTELYVPRLR
jgi:GWxTD domain-containing protein